MIDGAPEWRRTASDFWRGADYDEFMPSAHVVLLAKIAAAAAALALPLATARAAEEPLTVAWRDKPPYHYMEGGKEKGFLLERARKVFSVANVPARFVREPVKRIWANFDNAVRNYCSIGWYRLPERERMAQFSVPFYADPPQLVLAAPRWAKAVRAHDSFASLLGDPNLSIAMVDGASYGAQVDAMVEAGRTRVLRRTVGPIPLLTMVAAGRASFTLIDRHDWDWARTHEPSVRGVAPVQFPDMPPGQTRYIVCSKDVPQSVMARINHGIDVVTLEDRSDRPGSR